MVQPWKGLLPQDALCISNSTVKSFGGKTLDVVWLTQCYADEVHNRCLLTCFMDRLILVTPQVVVLLVAPTCIA